MPVMDLHTSISDVGYRAYTSCLVYTWQYITQKGAVANERV